MSRNSPAARTGAQTRTGAVGAVADRAAIGSPSTWPHATPHATPDATTNATPDTARIALRVRHDQVDPA